MVGGWVERLVATDSTSGRRHSFSRRFGGGPNKGSIKTGVLLGDGETWLPRSQQGIFSICSSFCEAYAVRPGGQDTLTLAVTANFPPTAKATWFFHILHWLSFCLLLDLGVKSSQLIKISTPLSFFPSLYSSVGIKLLVCEIIHALHFTTRCRSNGEMKPKLRLTVCVSVCVYMFMFIFKSTCRQWPEASICPS